MEAIFGPTVLRFAAMFAAWATLYKATHNSLRLLTSTPQPRSFRSQSDPRGGSINMERLDSSSSSTSDDNHPASGSTTPPAISELSEEERAKHKADTKRKIFMGDPRSRVWHAYLAGAVSSLAILVERKQDRISLAQQLFVRGLEGTYNVAHSRGKINIPHGAVLTFGLACGQIMYAWLVSLFVFSLRNKERFYLERFCFELLLKIKHQVFRELTYPPLFFFHSSHSTSDRTLPYSPFPLRNNQSFSGCSRISTKRLSILDHQSFPSLFSNSSNSSFNRFG